MLPSLAAAIGHPVRTGRVSELIELPAARGAVVVLIDGLGDRLLRQRGGHAPFLRSLLAGENGTSVRTLTSAFPSTTATSMGLFGTGELPGAHGLVGTDVLDPSRDVMFSQLGWDPAVDPHDWQRVRTVFESLAADGVRVVRIGPAYFDGSGLTEAALRGGSFVGAATLDQRVDEAVRAVTEPLAAAGRDSRLVYVYWGDLDKTGHVHGCGSWQWGDQLTLVDLLVRRLAERLPADVLLAVTADHGMVDVPFTDRLDVAHESDLAAGVRHVGGEPRALHLYCRPGAVEDVLAAWRSRLGDRMELVTREQAVREGWFGPVAEHVLPRIGDVVGCATGRVAVVDSRVARPELLRLLGQHGARTPEECLVPLIVTPGRA